MSTSAYSSTPPGSAPTAAHQSSEAIRRLYRDQYSPLMRYVCGLLRGDVQRAEDIVQETLVRAWLSAADQPPGWEPPRAWLFRVAHNLVIDWTRREQARPEIQHDRVLEAHPEPVDQMSQAIHRRFLVHALSRLSPPHREVLVYVYLLGCSGTDTADALGIPPGTVKSRMHHAMRELRRRHPEPAAVAA